MNYLELVYKCIFFYFVIVIALRVMGKREVGELSVLDIVIYFVMSELLALSISEPDQSLIQALVAIITLSSMQILMSWICLKKKKWRDFFEGRPEMIIVNGHLDQRQMRRQRYTVDDLLCQLRMQQISSVEEVRFAVLENSGQLTVLTKKDCTLNWVEPLIADGVIQKRVLDQIGKEEQWLLDCLKQQGCSDPSTVFLCLWQDGGLHVIPKENKDPDQMQKGGQ